ncbi:MAG: helix-turn-helix transcriptional regulator [Deltaproteobacteria bacterium]|jgi:hypothetical protein|nr:helix-turn-helix transcriptional regulator [Deltaproteobacteria bacterium]
MLKELKTNPVNPSFRYTLKGEIIKAGYRNVTDFSKNVGIDVSRLSQIIRGWQFPGPKLQRRIAKCLGITLQELKGLLE